MERGFVFNIQRFSVHDGPGIRSTVFLKGCPLSCVWCHNPEGIAPAPEVVLSPRRCIDCGECVPVCPQGLPAPGDVLDSCLVCGACTETCPTRARQVAGVEMTVLEVMAELVKDRVFFEQSGGGVTFSGGEPLGQPRFLLGLLRVCREQRIHTAVDTSGLAPWQDLEAVAELADLLLYDIKHLDDAAHRRFTGVSNARILANLRRLSDRRRRIWLRVPVIPGVNDSVEDLRSIGELAASLGGIEKVCLLPYHPLGEDKLGRQGRRSVLENIERPSVTKMQSLANVVETMGVAARLGG